MLMHSQSSFERLANHNPVLDHIAFYLAVDPFLGPPAYLVSLLLTCRTVHNHLSIANNSQLYADIFRHKFDYAAVERRLSAKWTAAPCLAQELCSRFTALKHIRNGKPSLPSDRISLWNAYLMMLENDGRNEQQLLSWANLPHWVLDAVVSRSSSSLRSPCSSPSFQFDPEGISLAVWLLWMTTSKESVGSEAATTRTALINALIPFIVRGYQFPSVLAPDAHFYLPLCEEHEEVTNGFSGPPPFVTQISYFGHKLNIAVPPVTPAALLNFAVRREYWQDNSVLPARISDLPATREEAIARNLPSPRLTQEDVREFYYLTRTRFFEYNHNSQGVTSERLDKEWFRLVACHTPWAVDRPLKGVVYPLGTLVGNWCGRMLIPDMNAHIAAVMNERIPPTSVPLVQERLSCRFEEHHCLMFNEPLLAPPCPSELGGEDIFNAWLPRDLRFTRRTDGLEIFDPSTGENTWYETYHPDRALPYSAAACERLRMRPEPEWCSQSSTEIQEDTEDGDEYEDFVEEKSSGVQDIIITGETCEKQGEAWGYYSYIGRVRSWDGLVVLLRIAINNQNNGRGRWIFKGYVHQRSLVGRWRDTATGVQAIGFEGGFVLCKEDEATTTASDA
ncbi:hypothetical protein BDN67DRAFT_968916 [Paxillus ammoniavirescens]|nr:hypothetical protein BDN67DRAFT_968916 [Paxillus ammoniavirescens]